MRTRTIILILTLCLVATAICFAADANMGTWKLNEAKSKFSPTAPRNHTVIYEAAGENIKVIVHGTSSDGKAISNEWIGKFDGKDYPVTGDPNSDARSYTQVDPRTLDFAVKKDGKVTVTGRVVVAADGKSRTVTATATDTNGKKITSTAVYDKQ
ncbi:MAG: hypothetical protein ACRD2Q_06530 [Terriglobales bacterium]